MKTLTFEKGWIAGVEHVIKNAAVTSKIKLVAVFSRQVADALGVRWALFDKQTIPREGLKAIELDVEFENFRLTLDVPKLSQHKLDLRAEKATKFKIVKIGSAKKKAKEPRMLVRFQVHYAGNPFEMLEYLLKAGNAEGRLKLEPAQREMFEGEKPHPSAVELTAKLAAGPAVEQ